MITHHRIEQIAALRALALSQPLPSRSKPPTTAPAALAPSRHAVRHVLLIMAKVMGKLRHLRLKCIADEQRRRAAQQDHRQDRRIGRRFAHQLDRAAETYPARLSALPLIPPMAGVGQDEHVEDRRQIHQCIDEQSRRRRRTKASSRRQWRDRKEPRCCVPWNSTAPRFANIPGRRCRE